MQKLNDGFSAVNPNRVASQTTIYSTDDVI